MGLAMPDAKKNYNPLNDTKLLDDINNAFIKKFKTDKYHYIYDVNTNEIVKVDEVIWNLFPDTEESYKADLSQLKEKHGKEELHRALNEISSSIDKDNLFSSNRPKIGMLMSKEELEQHIRHKNEHTILNVTDDCNFRCKYCIYSGIYKNVRTHSKKYMSWETAKAAIDDFIINSSGIEDPSFSFYGGEPMLAMDLIKSCVLYIKNMGINCRFSITTNGSICDKDAIKYLIDNEFNVSISLNGPKSIHDAYRVYSSGKGTYEDIIRNIDRIRKIDENYFRRKVGFSCTFTPPYRIEASMKFFLDNFPGSRVTFSRVDDENTDYFEHRYSDYVLNQDYYKQIVKLFGDYIEYFINEKDFSNYSWLLGNLCNTFPLNIHRRPIYSLSDSYLAQGQCIVGSKKIFINTEGYYFPCERVKDSFFIGDVFQGIDYSKIYYLLKEFNDYHTDKCYGCHFVRLCSKCIKEVYYDNKIIKNKFDKLCNNNRKSLTENILLYMNIYEMDSSLLEKVERIQIK